MSRFSWNTIPVLTTSRLRLRALEKSDQDALFQIYGDPEVMQFASDPAFPNISYIEQMLASINTLFEQHQSVEWGITLKDANQVIGTCGFHSFTPDTQAAEIGCLLRRLYWGQGLMHEALSTLIPWGLEQFGLDTLYADIDEPNLRSRKLFQRLGFQLDQEHSLLLTLKRADWKQ